MHCDIFPCVFAALLLLSRAASLSEDIPQLVAQVVLQPLVWKGIFSSMVV